MGWIKSTCSLALLGFIINYLGMKWELKFPSDKRLKCEWIQFFFLNLHQLWCNSSLLTWKAWNGEAMHAMHWQQFSRHVQDMLSLEEEGGGQTANDWLKVVQRNIIRALRVQNGVEIHPKRGRRREGVVIMLPGFMRIPIIMGYISSSRVGHVSHASLPTGGGEIQEKEIER